MIIKICGITRQIDAQAVIDAGADMLGLMFVERSARYIKLPIAREISLQVVDRVKRVGVFADHSAKQVEDVLAVVPLDILQFSGNENASFCRQFEMPYIKTVFVNQASDWSRIESHHEGAEFLLLDSPGGGTGKVFDWDVWPGNCSRTLMLAGGLTPENVGAAVAQLIPAGVDVSGGVEGSVKGIKMAKKIDRFVREVRRVEVTI